MDFWESMHGFAMDSRTRAVNMKDAIPHLSGSSFRCRAKLSGAQGIYP